MPTAFNSLLELVDLMETVIAQNTTLVQDHDLSGNFSLGRVGFWVAGGQATFWNLTVTPETCEQDPQANCGYDCKEDPTYHYPDKSDNGLAWWGDLINHSCYYYLLLFNLCHHLGCHCIDQENSKTKKKGYDFFFKKILNLFINPLKKNKTLFILFILNLNSFFFFFNLFF